MPKENQNQISTVVCLKLSDNTLAGIVFELYISGNWIPRSSKYSQIIAEN